MEQRIHMMVESANTINFCGKQIHTLSGQVYQAPFKVEPTTGDKHDYKTCVGCKENYDRNLEVAKSKFRLFPNCCERHKKLNKLTFFKLEDFVGFPKLFADKAMFSVNHIINNIDKDDWFVEITNYLDYVIKSFGYMPKDCGEPFMVSAYIDFISNFLKNNERIYKPEKVKKLIYFFDHYYEHDDGRETDLNILIGTYQKWLNIFPFRLPMFAHLKNEFEKHIPILREAPVYNPYLKAHRGYFLDKESLIKFLINRTDQILKEINTLRMYEKGELTDADNIKLGLILESRKLKLDAGYDNNLKDEQDKYRKILKDWFDDEKRFIDDITPYLKRENVKPASLPKERLKINQIALIHVYKGEQITRHNADEIAALYGYNSKNSGEGLFQDYINYSSTANRRGKPIPCTPKKLKNKIELFESITKYLSGKALALLNDEIRLLKTIFQNEYD